MAILLAGTDAVEARSTRTVLAGRFLTGMGLSTNWKDWHPVRGIAAANVNIRAKDFIRTSQADVGNVVIVGDIKLALIISKTGAGQKVFVSHIKITLNTEPISNQYYVSIMYAHIFS